MTITSTAFQEGEFIPSEYTCEGTNINPPLTFSEIPNGTESLVLVIDDPDAPHGLFTHWLLYDMSPATLQILENALPATGKQGMNDFQTIGYGGPCPPSGVHRYYFKLYALKTMLNLNEGMTRQELEVAMKDQIIDLVQLMGKYEKGSAKNHSLSGQNVSEYTDDRDTSDGQLISR